MVSKTGILREEAPIYSKYCELKYQKNSYKEFCVEYSPLWDRNMDDTQSGKKRIEGFQTWRWRKTLGQRKLEMRKCT